LWEDKSFYDNKRQEFSVELEFKVLDSVFWDQGFPCSRVLVLSDSRVHGLR